MLDTTHKHTGFASSVDQSLRISHTFCECGGNADPFFRRVLVGEAVKARQRVLLVMIICLLGSLVQIYEMSAPVRVNDQDSRHLGTTANVSLPQRRESAVDLVVSC